MLRDAGLSRLIRYQPELGPHASVLLGELQLAASQGAHATVIILAAVVLDVVLHEPTGLAAGADGMDIAAARDSREAYWLRQRRNGLVHYQSGQTGMMGENTGIGGRDSLAQDARRALAALADALDMLIREAD